MKPRNFPTRRALRKAGVKRAKRLPHVADTKFRAGAKKREALSGYDYPGGTVDYLTDVGIYGSR